MGGWGEAHCALVISTNIATTSTATASDNGATSNVRWLAEVHVMYNLVTGAVALLTLPPRAGVPRCLGDALDRPATPAAESPVRTARFGREDPE